MLSILPKAGADDTTTLGRAAEGKRAFNWRVRLWGKEVERVRVCNKLLLCLRKITWTQPVLNLMKSTSVLDFKILNFRNSKSISFWFREITQLWDEWMTLPCRSLGNSFINLTLVNFFLKIHQTRSEHWTKHIYRDIKTKEAEKLNELATTSIPFWQGCRTYTAQLTVLELSKYFFVPRRNKNILATRDARDENIFISQSFRFPAFPTSPFPLSAPYTLPAHFCWRKKNIA